MDIVEEIRRDPENGARRLEAEYKDGLMSLAMRFCDDRGDAEELVNGTFAAVVENIDDFLQQSSFFSWMCQILVRKFARATRRKSYRMETMPGDVPEMEDEKSAQSIYENADAGLLREAIETLPPEDRKAVVMHYFMDVPVGEIAKVLSVPSGTVKWRLHHARMALAAKLGGAAKKHGAKALVLALALCGALAFGAVVAAVSGAPAATDGNRLRSTATENPATPSDTMKLKSFFPAAFGAMFAAAAASGETVHLTTSDKNGSSFDTWDVTGGGTEKPSASNDYVVDANLYVKVIWNRTFPGKSIAFGSGTESSTQGGLVVQRGNSDVGHSIGFGNEGAILQNGYFTTWESNRTPTLAANAGPLVVTAPEANPFRIAAAEVSKSSTNTNNAWTIAAPIKGEAGTALMLCAGGVRNGAVVAPAKADTFTVTGSMADFRGSLVVSGGLAGSAREAVPVSAVLAGKMGGTTVVQPGASIRAQFSGTTFTTASLVLQGGATLRVNNKPSESACGKIAVTESLSVEKGAVVQLVNHPYSGSGFDAYDWVALTLPADKGTIPLENFSCPDVETIPTCTLSTNLVDGVWRLVVHKRPHDVLMANDGNGTTIRDALASACTNAASWKSGEAPRAGRAYVAASGIGGLASGTYPVIRTPYHPDTATPFVFAGDSLELGAGAAILPCTRDVTFPRLVLSPNSTYVLSLASVPAHLRGSLHLRASDDAWPQRIQAYMRGLSVVDAGISGSGTLHVVGRSGSGSPYGDIEFTALNTNFTGKVKVFASVNNKPHGPEDYSHERVFLTDARNLGGPLDAFRADALELAEHSVLEARRDVDLDVANRGVTISGDAGFAAPAGATLAISNDITWNGTARKTGAGDLAIGGSPRIAPGATAALSVEEGTVSAKAAGALDGVAVTLAEGAYLLVDPAASGDLAEFGAIASGDAPFGMDLHVAFKLPEGAGLDYKASSVAVCTVADAAKAKALADSATTRRMRGLAAVYSTRANDDGTATVLASIASPALVVVVR